MSEQKDKCEQQSCYLPKGHDGLHQAIARIIPMDKEQDGVLLREKIDELLRSEMVTIGIDIDDAKTGQMWAYDSERLSKRIIALFPDIGEAIQEERKRILDYERKSIPAIRKEAKKQEKESIVTHLDKLCKHNPIRTGALRQELGKYIQALKKG